VSSYDLVRTRPPPPWRAGFLSPFTGFMAFS